MPTIRSRISSAIAVPFTAIAGCVRSILRGRTRVAPAEPARNDASMRGRRQSQEPLVDGMGHAVLVHDGRAPQTPGAAAGNAFPRTFSPIRGDGRRDRIDYETASLGDVLAHERGRENLLRFMKAERSQEALAFVALCDTAMEQPALEARAAVLAPFFGTYVPPGASHQINLGHKTQTDLVTAWNRRETALVQGSTDGITQADQQLGQWLPAARTEAFEVIRRDTFERFKRAVLADISKVREGGAGVPTYGFRFAAVDLLRPAPAERESKELSAH